MNDSNTILKRIRLALIFALTFFFTMLLSMLVVFLVFCLLHALGFSQHKLQRVPILTFGIVSLIVGTILSCISSRLPLAPLRCVMNASEKIANGDYSVRINLTGPCELVHLTKSFNHMAEELDSVEMLRNDFVNNFSHEFKTPIVSIRGFAKMLKRDDLSPEERNEYLDIIINESERLTELATNVLYLSKIEQQNILTDINTFNVSEQIRLSIALLDSKWSTKHIEIVFSSEEIYIDGNEELLKQVWINLIDNAIKFSPDYSTVEIKIKQEEDSTILSFIDQGEGMSEETLKHLFDKFYQGDTSHAVKGNGIGLTIVKHIVGLHNGIVEASCLNSNGTTFTVKLPLIYSL